MERTVAYIERSVLPFDQRMSKKRWRRVEFTTDGCWIWMGWVSPLGYGTCSYKDVTWGVHRAFYDALVGPITAPSLDHLCRNPSCVNPAHLEAVTMRVNVLRGLGPTAMLAKQTECKRGHPLMGRNLMTSRRGYRECRRCHYQRIAEYRARCAVMKRGAR